MLFHGHNTTASFKIKPSNGVDLTIGSCRYLWKHREVFTTIYGE